MFVGFNRRFDPSFSALKRRLDAGEIGAVEQVVISSRDPARRRSPTSRSRAACSAT